jgi:hypothetical protein
MSETTFNPSCVCGGSIDNPNPDCERCALTAQLADAKYEAEGLAKELHLLQFGAATLVERFHHWGQSDGDMGWAKGMREASDELAALLAPAAAEGATNEAMP